jgi:hypothetical protein
MTEPEEIPRRMSVSATPDTEVGVYANFVAVWHEPHCFVLDFAAYTQPPQLAADPDNGEQFVDLRARLVSRIRVPPDQVFEIMKALEQQLSAWERETGRSP